MGALSYVKTVIVLFCFTESVIATLPITGSTLDCNVGTIIQLGVVDEGYTGDIEIIPSTPDADLALEVSSLCPQCEEFLEFTYSPIKQTARVRTKKPLDTEALRETGGVLSYEIICNNTGVPNRRTLFVIDVNDNKPVFDREEYRAYVLETLPINEVVVQVRAVDADLSPAYNHITYSIQPPSTMFEANIKGKIFLREHLNYTTSSQHNFTVKAQDADNYHSEARVIISVVLTPQFEYDHYQASIPENEVVPVLELLPAPIKASTMGDHEVIYSISEVSPSNYWSNFTIDQSTGVIKVVTELNFEEMKDPAIIIHMEASLKIDSTITANTTVTVHVKNVNEAPVFNVELYTAEIFSTALPNHVVKVEATDPDVGDTLQYSLVTPSSMFAVEPSSGQVYVVSAAGESGKVNLQVKAEDQGGLYDTTTVEVTIKESDSKDVVLISVNQETGTVQNKTAEMEEALERALGWSVTIISVSNSRQISALSHTQGIHSAHRENTPRTFVSFIATEINGANIIPKETVQRKLQDDKENVVEEMEQVFGKGFQYDIVDDGGHPGISFIPIILGTVIPLVFIVAGLSICAVRRQSNLKKHNTSTIPLQNKGDSTNRDSMRGKPDLKDRDSMRGKPDLAEGRDSMRGKPDLKDRDSMRGKPDLKNDTDSMRGKPDLKDRDSMRGKPDLKNDMDSMRGKPDLKDRDSMRGKPDLKNDTDSMRGKPDLKDRDSMRGKPDLKNDMDSMRGKPDLKDRDSMRGKPDLKNDTDSMRGKPDLKDRDSMRGKPDLKNDTDSMRGKPDLKDRDSMRGKNDTDSMRRKTAVARHKPKTRCKLEF